MNAGCLFLQYEGMNPSGSFKDNGMTAAFTHARMVGAPAGGLRQHRQHQRVGGHLLRCDQPDAGHHLHRLGQDRLRQAGPGPRSRRADRADRRRLRRRLAARAAGEPKARHLSGQQHQSLPARRAEDDHVPHPRGPGLGGSRLDRRAGRQSRQRVELRQGVHRAAGTRPDRSRPASGRHQCRRGEHVLPALREARRALERRQAGRRHASTTT